MFDLLIKNGTIIDGTKANRYVADLGITNDRITAIGQLSEAEATQTIDAQGNIVAPGFIDVHTHADAWLLKTPHLVSKTMQGFTSEVIMADGMSYAPVNEHTIYEWIYYLRSLNALRFSEYSGWKSIGDYMALLNGRNVQNAIPHIPYANLRVMACGYGRSTPMIFKCAKFCAKSSAKWPTVQWASPTGWIMLINVFPPQTKSLKRVVR